MREAPKPPPLLADVMPAGGVSWPRVVTAIVLLALSLAIGFRGTRHQPAPKAVPQPVPRHLVAGADLPALQPEFAPLRGSTGLAAARMVRTEAMQPAIRHPVWHAAARPAARRVAFARREQAPSGHARQRASTAHALTRTRGEVEREYLRARDVVAAFTGEDSGSAYLMRASARERAARFDASRHESARSRSARG
jgi:hypothetical protein